ncbi:MAG: NAD-dependent epimerase/dehydratase family protein [Treponema sp.]|nr:NAD-dependent epimerase/dehydratase family protein [Treponema sp.]
MNILLLGGNGFLGKSLQDELLSRKMFSVFSFDLFIPSEKRTGVTYFSGKLSDFELLNRIIEENKISVVIHLVSTLIPASSLDEFQKEQINVINPSSNILSLCSQRNILFVYMSSGGTIYGKQYGVISEDLAPRPISYYGFSKMQMEELIKFYHRCFGLKYLILRPSNPYGYGQNLYGKQGIIAVSFGRIINNQQITVFGDGSNIRDYIYIKDYAFYIIELILKNIQNDTFNIGSGVGYSINQVLEIIQNIVGQKIDIEYVESRSNDVPEFVLDVSKLKSIIPHEQYKLEEGINLFYNSIKVI